MTLLETIQGAAGFLGTISLSSVAGALFGNYLIKTFISEKIKGQIKSEYDEKLAYLKSQLDDKLANTRSQLDKELEAHKARLKSEYDEKLETHKALLKSQSDVEIERIKSRLQITASKRQIQFTNLQEKRATVIANLHGYLSDLIRQLSVFRTTGKTLLGASPNENLTPDALNGLLSGQVKKLDVSYSKLDEYFHQNRIYIPKPTEEKIDFISGNLLLDSWMTEGAIEDLRDSAKRAVVAEFLSSYDTIKGAASSAVDELEQEFRILLGDDPSQILTLNSRGTSDAPDQGHS